MHGSLYSLLERFVVSTFAPETWTTLLHDTGLAGNEWDATINYGDEDMVALVVAASNRLDLTVPQVLEAFGEYIVPHIMQIFGKYADPGWRTFDTIANTEKAIHIAARRDFPGINPPVLNVTVLNENQLIVDYYSKRRMAPLAIGIIRGISRFYAEEDQISITSTTELDAERVQIKVEKIKV